MCSLETEIGDNFVKYARRITPINGGAVSLGTKPPVCSQNNCKTSRQMLASTLLGRYKLIEFT